MTIFIINENLDMEGRTSWRQQKKLAIYDTRRKASEETKLLSLDLQALNLWRINLYCLCSWVYGVLKWTGDVSMVPMPRSR